VAFVSERTVRKLTSFPHYCLHSQ